MTNKIDKKTDAERLDELKAELAKQFGKFTRWRSLCQEQNIISVGEQIRVAEEVLAAPYTGTNAEWLTYHLRLRGGKSFDVDEMLAGNGRALGKDEV